MARPPCSSDCPRSGSVLLASSTWTPYLLIRSGHARGPGSCELGTVRLACVHVCRMHDVPQPRLGQICRKVSFWRTIVLRHLAALRPST
eukprot:976359-Prymnesium_polylepis.1